jgi:hypothetical protein
MQFNLSACETCYFRRLYMIYIINLDINVSFLFHKVLKIDQ